MSRRTNNYFNGLVKSINTILPTIEKELSKDVHDKTELLKKEIETKIFENFDFLTKVLKQHYENKKESDAKKTNLITSLAQLKTKREVFDNITVENLENKKFKITYSFVNPIAKMVFKLFDMGSGTLSVPTTKILWKQVRKHFGEAEIDDR